MTEGPRRSSWGLAALVLVMVGLAGWLVANSALFAAREVRVLGNVRLTADQVLDMARLGIGDNLLRLRTNEAVRALERSPWVARASVERSLPSTVVVRIVERRPVAWMRGRGGTVVLAADGIVLERPSRPPPGLPFAGRWETAGRPGGRAKITPALRVAASLPQELTELVTGVRLEEGEVVLAIRGGAEARYGEPAALGAKHRALISVLEWARERRLENGTIDVRFPRTPALEMAPPRG